MPVKYPVLREAPTLIKSKEQLHAAFRAASEAAERAAFKANTADGKHALEVYNRVVTDGRFVKEFGTDPGGVARKLGLELSPKQIADVQAANGFATVANKQGQAADGVELVAVAIIVLVLSCVPDHEVVVDTSGIVKA